MFTFLSLPCLRRRAILALGALLGGLALAQDYPNRPITLVMPYAAGGPGDVITRIYAAALQKSLGQQVVVENPAGAAGSIGTAKVARSKPDGYTLLMIHVSHATNPFMFKSLSYNPVEDFEPIGLATEGPMLLVARKDFPARDAREFLDYVRANASKLSMGHAGPGSAAHLCNLKFMQALKVDITQVPYKGAAPALNDLMGGQLDLMCDQTSNNLPTVQSGRVRAYAVAGTQRLAQVPDVPSLQEAGLSGFEISIFFGMYAPKGTPKPVLDRLTAALQQAVRDPDVKARLAALATLPVPVEKARPEALRAHLKSEIDTLGPLLQGAGIKPE
jgi:tripartite-type tricarboxylate transporter receptor subunit TctC